MLSRAITRHPHSVLDMWTRLGTSCPITINRALSGFRSKVSGYSLVTRKVKEVTPDRIKSNWKKGSSIDTALSLSVFGDDLTNLSKEPGSSKLGHNAESASSFQRERRLKAAVLVSLLQQAQQQRSFSSNGKDQDRKDPPRTDPDFAEYLVAGNKDEPEGLSAHSRVESPTDAESKPLPPSHNEIPFTASPSAENTESYRYVRLKKSSIEPSRAKKNSSVERARSKTVANVRRALAGNVVICTAKFGAWLSSGSSSMLSEFIHSVVDCGNQSLLLIGLRDSGNVADRRHPYGYGKSVYFWALVSALGTFFLGAGISMTHAVGDLLEPSLSEINWQVWGVLGASLSIDGYVFSKTLYELKESMPKDSKHSLWSYTWKLRDPATLAILLEDGAACLGIVIAAAGIGATHWTGMPIFDGVAGVAISGLLAGMGVVLVRVNQRFLLGQAVDKEITEDIEKMLLKHKSIDNVYSVQSQWTGPETFSYKAEVDFDGTFLAAQLLPTYEEEFLQVGDNLEKELRVLLSWYAEDVIRTTEREVRLIEARIKRKYPGAEYIELEPMSKDFDRFAIDDGMEGQLRRVELEALNRYLKFLADEPKDDSDPGRKT